MDVNRRGRTMKKMVLGMVLLGTMILQAEPSDGWKMFDRRVGMFVHWGIYAVDGWHKQTQWRRGVPVAEYEKLMQGFTLKDYDPEKWIDLMEDAGMDYIVLTTKHHDGFCLWDTAETDYKVTNTPGGRDVLKELADACRRRGIRLGLYYSCPDWHHANAINFGGDHQLDKPNPGAQPDLVKYLDYVKRQVTELLTRYGRIECFFWDIPPGVRIPEMNDFVRNLQPGIKINPRGFGPGDYETPERAEANDAETLGANIPEVKRKKRRAFEGPVEGCDSVDAESWGYRVNADYRSVAYCERAAAKLLSRGGNLLLNVGPDADGRIPAEAQEILRRFGKWHKAVREAWKSVANDEDLVKDDTCIVTKKGEALYLTYVNGLDRRGVNLFPLDKMPKSAVLLNTGASLKAEVVFMPSSFWEGGRRDSLHVSGIPVDDLAGEPVVIRLEY